MSRFYKIFQLEGFYKLPYLYLVDLPDFSKIFHEYSKDHSRWHPPLPEKYEDWPDEWKTTYYKDYPRLPKIELADFVENQEPHDFFKLIKNRESRTDFSRGIITKGELSLILKYSCGTTGNLADGRKRRAQPSGGARFPIEVYPIVFRSNDSSSDSVAAGLYHYNVKEHKLDVLLSREFSDSDIDNLFNYRWVRGASAVIIMTAVFWRNQNKYGERGYRYILLEAGHIGQNLYLVSGILGLKCCALGGTNDYNFEKLIDIDGVTESVVYGVAIGK